MKVAILLPGYLDSPDYLHMIVFERRLIELGYIVDRLDLGDLWKTGNTKNYRISNFLKEIEERTNYYNNQNPEEIVLIGHSDGGFISIIAGNRIGKITRVIALCPPPNINTSINRWINKSDRISRRDLPKKPNTFREFTVPYSYVEDSLKYSATVDVKSLNKPLMIFIATEDKVNDPKDIEKIANNAKKPYVIRQQNVRHNFRESVDECNIVMKHIEEFLINK